jgi:hypothetical protein
LIEDVDDAAAEAFRDRMVRAGSVSGTVRQRVSAIKAVLIFVKKNKQLKDFINPFVGLKIANTDGKTAKNGGMPCYCGHPRHRK